MKITGRQQIGLFTGAMAKEVVVGYAQHPTPQKIFRTEFDPAEFNLGEELFSAVDKTWQTKDTFRPHVLMNPVD